MRCLGIDWSGRARGAERFIWIAEARDGELVALQDGRDRRTAVDHVLARAEADPELVAGFDFAFSFPAWYCARRGWRTGPEVWRAMAAEGEALLAGCPPPFWGRPGVGRRVSIECGRRRTDREDVPSAKSVFQIGGSGAVGTGSIRGMPELLRLIEAGLRVWPLHGIGLPAAVEIYPRALYGSRLVKSRAADRRRLLQERYRDQDRRLLARAASCEDAFDAAVTALVMSEHAAALRALPAAAAWRLEGRVWTPALSRGR
jgi:hypothetical protein